jgi:hypothetical protein
MNETKVEITVHERIDGAEADGFVVKLTAHTDPVRTRKLAVDDYDEAAALAESIARYLQGGGDLDVFLPDTGQDEATDAAGAP